jgi:hypothetical protein
MQACMPGILNVLDQLTQSIRCCFYTKHARKRKKPDYPNLHLNRLKGRFHTNFFNFTQHSYTQLKGTQPRLRIQG